MKKRFIYQITCQSSCYTSICVSGFSLDELKRCFMLFREDVKCSVLSVRLTSIVFSSESKAKNYVSMRNTSLSSLNAFVGFRNVSFEKFDYHKVELL